MSAHNWYEHKEKTSLGYTMMLFVLKFFPAGFMRFLAYIIGFFYWLFDKKSRETSRNYLAHTDKKSTLKHFCSFALNLVENVQSWAGKFSFKNVFWQNDDVQDLVSNINAGRGTVVVMSHLGNPQMMKALASMNEAGTERKMSITSIMDTELTSGFGNLVKKINPNSSFHLISSNNIGPDTVLLLQERLEKGEMVVVAGDRISAHTERFIELPFLGENAKFPYGVFLMIALLDFPTYFVTGLRQKDITLQPKYDMFVKKNPIGFDCTRKEREERIHQTAQNYVANLENLCKLHPYQWYNFFDFWG